MYEQAQQAQGAAGMDPNMAQNMGGMGADQNAGQQPADDNVVDADFEVVDDDK